MINTIIIIKNGKNLIYLNIWVLILKIFKKIEEK